MSSERKRIAFKRELSQGSYVFLVAKRGFSYVIRLRYFIDRCIVSQDAHVWCISGEIQIRFCSYPFRNGLPDWRLAVLSASASILDHFLVYIVHDKSRSFVNECVLQNLAFLGRKARVCRCSLPSTFIIRRINSDLASSFSLCSKILEQVYNHVVSVSLSCLCLSGRLCLHS